MNNHELVQSGFRALLNTFAQYIATELSASFGKNEWWNKAVMGTLHDNQKRGLPQSDELDKLVNSLDILCCLTLFDVHWSTVFKRKLSIDNRTWAKELIGVRHKLAHLGGEDFNESDTWRALDTMSRLAEQIDSETAEKIRNILRTSRYSLEKNSATKPKKEIGILSSSPKSELPSWRDVIEPHPDVAQGRYKNAEFAADLAQVARGEGALEYRDPIEFFARTFVTEGMTGLLEQSLRRICGKNGEPVIQLKTAFGGGKTHSMLALYHIMRGHVAVNKIPNINPVLERAGISSLPKANVAVLVGTALDPTKAKRPNNMPGITINTLWGEMAAQLAYSRGNLKIYDLIKEADRKGVSPGSETLKNLFDACAPCLILMDELVAYAKKLKGKDDLPAGNFDNFITFIQEITEAARASKNSLVVASIPESEIEIGGEAGKITLETIEHTFGRMESIWKPVTANEGFEVVRRRLFLNCKNLDGRDAVCTAFSTMYNDNDTDFPTEAKELEYKERMVSCYPIHPEVFDRLYNDWSTLERFQRTRGVLRLMAAVVYELWMNNDASLIIMPGSVPLDVPNVRDELTRHLSDNWNGIVDREVDGKDSVPFKTDMNVRYGKLLAARRIARVIMLGSAPTGREQIIKGIESSRIRLGVVQPGENIAVFNDALNTLRNLLTYLYTNPSGDRYWYDNRPTLRKTAEDRAQQFKISEVEYEIEVRLRYLRKEKPFAGIHICPNNTNDVPDEQTARLVVLHPSKEYKQTQQETEAIAEIKNIFDNRGTSPRTYRNMLIFVVADQDLMVNLKQAVRRYLAWKSIKNDSETLNLDATQNKETDNNLDRQNHIVDDQIRETYSWLIVPHIDRNIDMKTIKWEITKLSGGNDGIVSKSAKKAEQNELVIKQWSPMLLKMQLDQLLWKDTDEIEIKKLWEYLCTYCYLPRLTDFSILENTIREGLNSVEFFAYAAGIENGRYVGLKFNSSIDIIDRSGYLVKVDVAKKQLAEEKTKRNIENGMKLEGSSNPTEGTYPPIDSSSHIGEIQEPLSSLPKNTHFFMSAQLDPTRIGRDVQKLVEEVINHLTSVDGAQVKVSLEVNIESPEGVPQRIVRTVSENCRTLRIENFGFDG
jgi:predicted AAA+ superfamily ATPase